MNAPQIRTKGRSLAAAGAVLAGVMLAAPSAAAHASPLPAEEAGAACTVSDGTLKWGVKESFRSYISGSIANGSWETSDGADYEIPEFIWSSPTGSFDPETGTGSVSFTGAIHFTGHDGVLDLTLANPTIEFEGDGKAALLVDAKSTDVEGETTVDAEQEWLADLEVDDRLAPAYGTLDLSEVPATLTNSGVGAFADFYDAGADLDPVKLSLSFENCESQAPAEAPPAQTETPQPVAQQEARIPWLPIGIGGAALFVIGLTIGMLIGGRKPKAPQPAAQQPAQDQTS